MECSKLCKIARWLLDHDGFLDALLFEAVSLSKKLAHYEYDDKTVDALDALFDVRFLSPLTDVAVKSDAPPILENVHIIFDISRHNPITLRYVVTNFSDVEKEESAELLSFIDCAHMAGSYDDLEPIRLVIRQRLLTLSKGEKISNYGILNVGGPVKMAVVVQQLKKELNQAT